MIRQLLRSTRTATTLGLLVVLLSEHALSYSVLTHEELIDLAWNGSIRPLLLARFPNATEEQLREAHAYAYGGSAIQDMGYYPFGKPFFSNLTHYVRTGDFIAWLFQNARTIDEYAFAIGALSHYLGDSIGHSEAVNPAVAVEFPKLRQEFGAIVTYGESPHSHIRTEFAFDIDELTNLAFAPPAYLHFIGFKVPRKFLEQAFAETYGFDLHELLGRAHPALRSYRTMVRTFIPVFAQAEVVLHRHKFPPNPNDDAYRTFAERVTRTNYERNWKHTYRGPGFTAHIAIKIPDSKTEEWYLQGVNRTVDAFRVALDKLHNDTGATPAFANLDLDTGNQAKLGIYALADKTYAQLLDRLTSRPSRTIPERLKASLLEYYAAAGMSPDEHKSLDERLAILKQMKVTHSDGKNLYGIRNTNGD
jgi:hypothetical protein